MISKFKLVKRGFQKNLILIPGWATDYRIFEPLDLDYNYILPIEFNPFDFEKNLAEFLEQSAPHKISIFGWSMGAFSAVEFAHKYPDKTEELFLLSIRRRYNLTSLQEIESKLQKNKRAYLYKFYLDFFSPTEKESSGWFKKHLLKEYLEKTDFKDLAAGLDYLSCVYFKPQAVSKINKIRIFHGQLDRIAPLKDAQTIKTYLPQAEFISLKNSGHALFLNPDFKKIYNG